LKFSVLQQVKHFGMFTKPRHLPRPSPEKLHRPHLSTLKGRQHENDTAFSAYGWSAAFTRIPDAPQGSGAP
jgi:hypothetical protein